VPRITLANLRAVNQASITRAGARYTPEINPDAPNLQIRALITAIDAVSQSQGYRDRIVGLERDLRGAWAKPQVMEAFDRTEFFKVKKPYGLLSRKEKAEFNRPRRFTYLKDTHQVIVSKPKRIPATEMVEIQTHVDIPGVMVELPSIHFGWESYHSEENADRNPDYPAPALVESLGLRKRGGAVDLVDAHGRPGMLFRKVGDLGDGFRSNLLYIRADLLKKYLDRVGRCLVWINWGEREIEYDGLKNFRDDPEMQAVWDTHAHIHKQFVVWPGLT